MKSKMVLAALAMMVAPLSSGGATTSCWKLGFHCSTRLHLVQDVLDLGRCAVLRGLGESKPLASWTGAM